MEDRTEVTKDIQLPGEAVGACSPSEQVKPSNLEYVALDYSFWIQVAHHCIWYITYMYMYPPYFLAHYHSSDQRLSWSHSLVLSASSGYAALLNDSELATATKIVMAAAHL